MMTKTQQDQAKIEELRRDCPRVKIDAWYDNSGGPGTGKWKIRGHKIVALGSPMTGAVEQPVIATNKESLRGACEDFRAAYQRAAAGNLL